MDSVTIVGYGAALCSMTSFAPQAWKIIKSRDTSAISTWMYVVTVIGFALWLIFGLLKNEWPIIITNAVCFLLSGFILMMKVLPQTKRDAVADAIDPEAS
jgi:MtN3 and saliva related transmembrane protein